MTWMDTLICNGNIKSLNIAATNTLQTLSCGSVAPVTKITLKDDESM